MEDDDKPCELCKRIGTEKNFHHLIPRTNHKNKWFKKRYTKEEMNKGIDICKRDCHKNIHKFISEKEMGKTYNTIKMLLSHPKVKKYIEWISKR